MIIFAGVADTSSFTIQFLGKEKTGHILPYFYFLFP